MYYTIYKVTNLINGKYYIGKHQTKNLDDEYMGSGKLLRRAIQKYGIENFKKEILEIYDTEEKMNIAEKILVVVDNEVTYNLCPGGKGGFGYINDGSQKRIENCKRGRQKANDNGALLKAVLALKEKNKNKEWSNKRTSLAVKTKRERGTLYIPSTRGLRHSEDAKKVMSEKASGANNSQFSTIWITNGVENSKIRSVDSIPDGWYKGRNIKFMV